jgi:hypothetical protein
MVNLPKKQVTPEVGQDARPRRSVWDVVLLISTALALLALPILVTFIVMHASLKDPVISNLPDNLLVILIFLAGAAISALAIYAFFKGRRDARRPPKHPPIK